MLNTQDSGTLIETETGATSDPLLCAVEMPFRGLYYPMGFAVEVETNSPEVIEAAEESWGEFETPLFPTPALDLRIGVTDDVAGGCPPETVCRAHRSLLSIIADACNFSICDMGRGFAYAWLTKSAIANRAYFRYHFLESSALLLVASRYATPLHAACVSYQGRGVLLCGESGAGKSSLAYACARAGWKYTSDDATYLIQGRDDRLVVGNPHRIRFRPSAARLFQELKGRNVTPRAMGKPSIEIRTATLPLINTAQQCSIDYVVFLNRQADAIARIESYPRDAAFQWFTQTSYGVESIQEAQAASVRALLQANVVELSYCDLDCAIVRLTELVETGR